MGWYIFDNRKSIGQCTSGGVVILDKEHVDGARVTLEQDGMTARYAITCGIYGWLDGSQAFLTCGQEHKASSRT